MRGDRANRRAKLKCQGCSSDGMRGHRMSAQVVCWSQHWVPHPPTPQTHTHKKSVPKTTGCCSKSTQQNPAGKRGDRQGVRWINHSRSTSFWHIILLICGHSGTEERRTHEIDFFLNLGKIKIVINVEKCLKDGDKVFPLKRLYTAFLPKWKWGPETDSENKWGSVETVEVRLETVWMLIISTTGLQEPSMLCLPMLPHCLFTAAHQHANNTLTHTHTHTLLSFDKACTLVNKHTI